MPTRCTRGAHGCSARCGACMGRAGSVTSVTTRSGLRSRSSVMTTLSCAAGTAAFHTCKLRAYLAERMMPVASKVGGALILDHLRGPSSPGEAAEKRGLAWLGVLPRQLGGRPWAALLVRRRALRPPGKPRGPMRRCRRRGAPSLPSQLRRRRLAASSSPSRSTAAASSSRRPWPRHSSGGAHAPATPATRPSRRRPCASCARTPRLRCSA